MIDVAIVGAGELGGLIASLVASRDIARTVHLVDDAGQVAAGKALDIMQAGSITSCATQVTGGTDVTMTAGAAVTVLADRAAGGEWQTEEGLLLLKRLAFGANGRLVLCAGAGQRELVERGVREAGFSRMRLFGTAPEALASALRAMVALEAHGSPRDVALTVLGVPPKHVVIPWGDATIGGISATRVLDEPARRRLAALAGPLWPPGPQALATAAAKALTAVLGGSRQRVSAFVAPDDSQGRRARAAALPVRLDAGGISRVELPPLSSRDQVDLDNAMTL